MRKDRWRRLGMSAALPLVVGTAIPAGAETLPAIGADTVLRHGFIYTVDARDSVAQAMAIDEGKIIYVGDDAGVRRFIGRKTEVIDLKGRMVMPGLHEGHIHDISRSDQKTCDLKAEPLTVEQFQSRVGDCLADPELGSKPDDFLQVTNLYMQFLRPAGTTPHKRMLDALGTERPIVVSAAVTGHTILVNQKALDLAGITKDTPDPPAGRINHDKNGEPNGLLEDAAADLVTKLIPPPPPISAKRTVELAALRMRDFSKEGITSFFVPGSDPDTIRTFQQLRKDGGLTARAHFAIFTDVGELRKPKTLYKRLAAIRKELEHPREIPVSVRSWRPGKQKGPRLVAEPGISVDGVKIFLDGIAQYPAQTAAMLKPYLDVKGKPRTGKSARGELYIDGRLLNPVVTELERQGYQAHIHAIGDRAVRTALDAFEAARKANPSLRAHQTIAHAEVVDPADYKRFGTLDVTASMGLQWAKPAPDSTEAVKPYLGKRFDLYEPTEPITRGGGKVSLGSDCCLDPFDEWFGLEVSILREADWGKDFPQYAGKVNALPGLSLPEAIRAVTINGAYQMHQEKVTGSLEPGKLADLVVLNQNITKVPLDDISKTDVLMTMVGGRKVWVDRRFQVQ
ncbi:amidohydrolase [Microbispora sp. NEAU-D428]|uniref:amidohydrolase n=1 Tax=Microbispora sitophila TaxID=2771537 RepID=UPI001866CB11|nr:amidohydrolase [Microbispora sitophila]MBE3013208.1 amidohydrolase [Microbispora sitophila]